MHKAPCSVCVCVCGGTMCFDDCGKFMWWQSKASVYLHVTVTPTSKEQKKNKHARTSETILNP